MKKSPSQISKTQMDHAVAIVHTKKRIKEIKHSITEAAFELLTHFHHRNLEAVVKVIKNTLESLRKRIAAPTMIAYGKGWISIG